MTKTKLHQEITALLSQYEDQFKSKKSFEAFTKSISELTAPKSGGGVAQNPMIESNGINYYYCRYTGYYLPESEMVMSNGKSKGYSKKAIAKWTKAGKDVQAINDLAMKLLLEGNVQDGTLKANEAQDLKDLRNKVEYYDDIRAEYEDIKLAQ